MPPLKQTRPEQNHEKKPRIFSLLIAGILIAITVSSAACLTTISTPELPAEEVNTTTVVAEPVATGSLEVNGEPGYTVYLDGKRIGELSSPTQVLPGIEPGVHTVTVEQFGVTGTTEVLIEPNKKASVSIGLSKNQILLRMATVLGRSRH